MIRRIELINFMSHEHTVIEPAEGLTAVIGPNNCGKSAIVAALQIVCHNDNSTYVTRHGAKRCAVTIETDDGHVVTWERKGRSVSYTIDGERFDRLKRGGVPDMLHDVLRMPIVEHEANAFDVHVGHQKSPVFLLDRPGSHAAQFFASSSDASQLVAMQARHKEKMTEAKREQRRLDTEQVTLARDIETLTPAEAIRKRLGELEQKHAALLAARSATAKLGEHIAAQHRAGAELTRKRARAEALSPLEAPPPLQDDKALAKLITSLDSAHRIQAQRDAEHTALRALPAPPLLEDAHALSSLIEQLDGAHRRVAVATARRNTFDPLPGPLELMPTQPLEDLITAMSRAERQAAQRKQAAALLGELPAPPEPVDTQPLRELGVKLKDAIDHAAAAKARIEAVERELADAREALRDWATQQDNCPTCGAALDPDRLVASTEAGLGAMSVHAAHAEKQGGSDD